MNFADYFNFLEQKLQIQLQYRMALGRLNTARVALKHQGIWPNRADLIEFAEVTDAFFRANCEPVLGFPIDQASLIEYVEPIQARDALVAAEAAAEQGTWDVAALQVSIAFAYVVWHHGLSRDLDPWHRASSELSGMDREDVHLKRFLEDLERSVLSLQVQAVIDKLGIAPEEYEEFRATHPHARITMGGTPRSSSSGTQAYTQQSVRMGIDLVVRIALKLRGGRNQEVRSYGG